MKRNLKSLIGFTIGATDGEIGKVKEFYFDDKSWTMRYLIVETGSWLFGKKLLLSPEVLLTPEWEKQIFPVNLTKDQIKNSPDIDTDKPVSRQEEIKLAEHYPWGMYWGGGMGFSAIGMSFPVSLNETAENQKDNLESDAEDDQNLRSTDHVTGYNIKAIDRKIGNVEDYIINENTWIIEYIVVDTVSGKKVLIAPQWIKEIKWDLSEVTVNASAEQVENSPEYVSGQELSSFYEADLRNYYDSFINHVLGKESILK